MYFLKTIFPKLMTRTCTICVAISFMLFLLGNAMALPTESLKLDLEDYALFFVFSLILSASFYIFRIRLAKPFLTVFHFLICAADFFVIAAITGKLALRNTASWFVAIVLFVFVYALIFGAFVLIRYLLAKACAAKSTAPISTKNQPHYEKRF